MKYIQYIASLVIPIVICAVGTILSFSKKADFEDLSDGVNEGLNVCIRLVPTLIILMVAVSMLSASGAIDFLVRSLSPIGEKIGIPIEILPLILMRPVSGSASNAMIAELFEKYGADSFAGRTASVLLGSSDTIIYVCAVYFSSVGIKKTRHALPAAFLTMIFSVFVSCAVCRLFWGQ
ncbi:MAG: spore maturation protein [Eubacteriales bacterium]